MDSKNKARNTMVDRLEVDGRDGGEMTAVSIIARRCEHWDLAPGLTFSAKSHISSSN